MKAEPEMRLATCQQCHETQQAVIQKERLRALGQMASGIAHDINNSLTPIIGYTDYLLDGPSGISDENQQYLQCIRTAAGDIARLVEQVRQFYRHRHEDEPLQAVDVNALVEDVIELTRPSWSKIGQKNGAVLKFNIQCAADLPQVRENEGELREAIAQLVLNAIEALPKGGTLSVTTRLVPSEPGDARDRVLLEVSDNGLGMDEEIRQRCLEPFFTTKNRRGRGLGLAMVYGMIQRHDGTIQIETEPGCGTTVRLVFWACECRRSQRETPSNNETLEPLGAFSGAARGPGGEAVCEVRS